MSSACLDPAPIAPPALPALPAPSGSVQLMLLPLPPPMPRLSHSACLDPSLPPSPLPPFPPPAVQFISCSSPPPPCPVYLIIIVFKHAQYMPRSVPAPIAPSALPASSGSVYLMLLPLPPCPVYPIIIIFKHAQCMPRSVPAPAVQFISPPPCPVYLLIIVFKHAQCMPRSVLAPIAPPALPAPSGSVHLMLLPPPMPRLSHNKGYLSMPTACLDPSLPPLPLPPFPPPAVQFISCSSLPPHAPSNS